jgi:hypothetical protein
MPFNRAVAFAPLALFASGEQGVWYDPSDYSSMFQDAAGTTPVTGLEQPVGLLLDKSGRGNHASQATSASRPVLSARYNLLTQTEAFDNAAWTKSSGSITSTAVTDPLGGSTADEFTSSGVNGYVALATAVTVDTNINYTFAVWLKVPSGTNSVQIGIVTSGLGNIQSTSVTVTTAWQRFSISGSTGANASAKVIIGGGTTIGTGEVVHIWGADLRVTNDGVGLPAYQRVGAATAGSSTAAGTADYDSTGFPPYLRFDGTDDSMATAAIDFTATDKMSVFAGVRKLSDAAAGVVAEIGATGLESGIFNLIAASASGANSYRFVSRGTASANAGTGVFAAAPDTSVLTGIGNISGDIATLRRNGSVVQTDTGEQGTGNYTSQVLYLGSRGGSSARLNGRLYSLIVRGAASTAAEITNTETWVNGKTKAYA